MTSYTAGDSRDLAEIIVDHKAKTVKILNPDTRKPLAVNSFLSPALFLFAGILSFAVFLFIITSLPYDVPLAAVLVWLFLVAYIVLLVAKSMWPKSFSYLHYLNQMWKWEFSADRKLVKVTKLNSKIYKLPYAFKNMKLDCRAYGDFKKYMHKIHIFPKDYYWKRLNSVTRQMEEWEAWFYFTRIPKKGRMEIDFI